jgi:hypothetical protein
MVRNQGRQCRSCTTDGLSTLSYSKLVAPELGAQLSAIRLAADVMVALVFRR